MYASLPPSAATLAVATLAVLCFAGHLAADEPAAGDKPNDRSSAATIFDQLDRNGDGQLTADEVPDDKQTLFRRLLRTADNDKDGKLSRSEFADGLESKRPARALVEKLPERNPGGPLGQDPEKTFARLDANGDGKIVADEVPDQARGLFERMLARADKDGDGAITKQELTAAVSQLKPAAAGKAGQAEPAKMFEYLDKNADGKISADEIPEGRPMIAQLLKRGDKDGDGTLSREEFTAGITAFRNAQQGGPNAGRPKQSQPNGGKPNEGSTPAGRQRRPGANRQRVAERFAKMDADHDGKVSRDEFAALQSKRFAKIDSNGDGYLEPSEIRQQAAAAVQNAGGNGASRNRPDRKPAAVDPPQKPESQPESSDSK